MNDLFVLALFYPGAVSLTVFRPALYCLVLFSGSTVEKCNASEREGDFYLVEYL